MGCFDNLVTLREYCAEDAPLSDVYLNDIGLNQSLIEDILTGDYQTVRGMVNSTINASVKEIAATIGGHFRGEIKTHSAIEQGVIGVPSGTNTVITGSGFRGVKLSLHNSNSYIAFALSGVSLHLNYTGNVNVLVYDLNTNELLDTIAVDALPGQTVKVFPNKKYTSYYNRLNLWIGYDSDGINSFETLSRSSVCCGNYGRKTEYLQATPMAVTGAFIDANLTALTTTSGIGIDYSIWCDLEAWLCTYSRMLAMPIAHKTAAEIFRRGLMVSPTTRTNNSTTVNSDLLKMNYDYHMASYLDGIKAAIEAIHLPTNNACFVCHSRVTNRIILP